MSGTVLETPSSATDAPRACRARFLEALNGAELAVATACLSRRACLVTPDGTAVHGRDSIRPLLAQMASRTTRIWAGPSELLQSGEAALLHESWQISSAGVGGEPFVQQTLASLVLNLVEGKWKLSILAPWGRGAMGATVASLASFREQQGR
jgi:ketosteroid isomerase-like protein